MNILALDTSIDVGSVAVLRDGILLAESLLRAPMELLSWLSPAIQRILRETDLAVNQLDGIAVGIGPGSFTGMRLQLATARTLAQIGDIPLFGISSLEALAFQCLPFHGMILSSINAHRGEVFAGFFRADGATLTQQGNYLALSPEALVQETLRYAGPWILTGETNPFKTLLLEKLSDSHDAGPQAGMVRASTLGLLAYQRRSEKRQNLYAIEPIYVRPSQAEIEHKKKALRS